MVYWHGSVSASNVILSLTYQSAKFYFPGRLIISEQIPASKEQRSDRARPSIF